LEYQHTQKTFGDIPVHKFQVQGIAIHFVKALEISSAQIIADDALQLMWFTMPRNVKMASLHHLSFLKPNCSSYGCIELWKKNRTETQLKHFTSSRTKD